MSVTVEMVIMIVGFISTAFGLHMAVKSNRKTDAKEVADQAVTLAIIKQDLESIKSGLEEMRDDMKTRNQLYHKMQGDLNNLEKRLDVWEKEVEHKFNNFEDTMERVFKEIDGLKESGFKAKSGGVYA